MHVTAAADSRLESLERCLRSSQYVVCVTRGNSVYVMFPSRDDRAALLRMAYVSVFAASDHTVTKE